MQAGKADRRERAGDSRKYAADKPGDCKHCYFWKGKRKGCSQEECYYLLPEGIPIPGTVTEKIFQQKQDKGSPGGCQSCPYGRHFLALRLGRFAACVPLAHAHPCIGYCIQKILREMREKKQSAGKEGERLAGRGK